MRQGNSFTQRIEVDYDGDWILTIPIEIIDELSSFDIVVWETNPDGTYTLRPRKLEDG